LARLAFVAAVLLTAIAGWYQVLKLRADAEWKAYAAEARARGVKLYLAEYVPPPIPDERNFAAIPLFQDSFKSTRPNPLEWPNMGGLHPPPLSSPHQGKFIDFAEWQTFFVRIGLLTKAGENPAADVLQALNHYAPQMDQLHAARERPETRFPIDYNALFTAALPHLTTIQSAGRIDSLRMAAHLSLGDSTAAHEDFRDGLRLYEALEHEPTLISALVRLSVLAMQEGAVAAGLQKHQWHEVELAKIEQDLGRIRLIEDYAFGVKGERGLENTLLEQFRDKGTGDLRELVIVMRGFGRPPDQAAINPFWFYPSGWLRRSQTRSNRFIDEGLAQVSQDPPRVFPGRPVPDEPKPAGSWLGRLPLLFFHVMAPALGGVEQNCAYGQTLLDETRLGCALERYRLSHGNFPAALDAVAPDFPAGLPRDVMNGEPFHYRLEDDGAGYTLYSVGWNQKDDGGRMDPKAAAKSQPDWVWIIRR
jgi:hypothetical protein